MSSGTTESSTYLARQQEFGIHLQSPDVRLSVAFRLWWHLHDLCAGYLGRRDLVTFLKKAKVRLAEDSDRVSRNTPPKSFIFLLDNLLDTGEEPQFIKGQQVRSEEEFESIFKEAGVLVHKRS